MKSLHELKSELEKTDEHYKQRRIQDETTKLEFCIATALSLKNNYVSAYCVPGLHDDSRSFTNPIGFNLHHDELLKILDTANYKYVIIQTPDANGVSITRVNLT